MSTNRPNTFITVSPDSPATKGETPAKAGSVAALQYALLAAEPYAWTSDDLLFEVHARRHEIAPEERAAARHMFFAKPQACLRASPLVKTFGWGLHTTMPKAGWPSVVSKRPPTANLRAART